MSNYIIIYTGNEVLMKQIKTLKTKKAAAAAKGKKAPKQLDEATMKEVRIFPLYLYYDALLFSSSNDYSTVLFMNKTNHNHNYYYTI